MQASNAVSRDVFYKKVLASALENLEEKITVWCKPAEGCVTIIQDDLSQFSVDIPISKMEGLDGSTELDKAMTALADDINRHGQFLSIPTEKPKGVHFADIAVGGKVYLRMVACYLITEDRFIARFDTLAARVYGQNAEEAA